MRSSAHAYTFGILKEISSTDLLGKNRGGNRSVLRRAKDVGVRELAIRKLGWKDAKEEKREKNRVGIEAIFPPAEPISD